jgi:O-acetyl-ADP-ribose deacetylase (regulator of RNase III)
MSIYYCQGDLFASGLPALAHGVNCQGRMGAGIARDFASRWPRMRELYEHICCKGILRPGEVFSWQDPDSGLWVFNLATQLYPGRDARPWAIATAVGHMILACQSSGIKQAGLPLIGCGIGGLEPSALRACLAPFDGAPVDLIIHEYRPAEVS